MSSSLYQRFVQSFVAYSQRTLIETEQRTWTYRDAETLAGQLARVLQQLGVKPGDRLMAQTEKSAESLILYLACLRTGAIYVPLNDAYTEAELAYFVDDAEPTLAVCRDQCTEVFSHLGNGNQVVRTVDALISECTDSEALPASRDSDDVAAILYTSGTTGHPKGAMLTQRNLISNAETLVEHWRFSAQDRLIHALPIFHAHGLFVAVHCVLLCGATMIFLPRFDAGEVIDHMATATVFMGVPTHYMRLLNEANLTRQTAAHMRLFIAGSAPLSADTLRAFEQRTGHRVLERYGMTETLMLTSNPYDGERRAGSVGPPLPGVELRITDEETGRELPMGEVGLVEVRGPNVFSGYWRKPEKTRAEFRPDGYFVTGDMGFVEPDGYVQLVGRTKDLIISGGLNVYPAEVESILDDRPEIVESAVIGVPHPDFGEAVLAVVRVANATEGFDKEKLRSELKQQLAGFKIPKDILRVDALPRNAMGKIQKKQLREQFAEHFRRHAFQRR